MKKVYHLFFVLLLCSQGSKAQDLIGKITEQDSAHTPLYMAVVEQMQNGKTIATYKTYFDGTYHIKVSPGQTYQLRASFPGRADTTVSISVDKHAALYIGTIFISLRKDGMRLTGYILDQAQDKPIRDACIILRNVMTRKEERYTTGTDGSYNLKMDYETNYTLKIDKMSPGIINKYQDTSFNISTIGFNKPLDFRLDIRFGPATSTTVPRTEYDLHTKVDNRNLKPALAVVGAKDTLRKHEQDSIVAMLNRKLTTKDSAIASLDKRIGDIHKVNNENKVALKDADAAVRKMSETTTRRNNEADSIKQHLAAEQRKAEADLMQKKQAEKELQEKLDKQISDAETRKQQLQAQAAQRELQQIAAEKEKAQEDSLLKIALEKNKEILARRKHVKDSLSLIEDQKTEVKVDVPRIKSAAQEADIANTKTITADSPKPQAKTDIINTVETARVNDSIRIKNALLAQQRKKAVADSLKVQQDSLLMVAMMKNKDLLARRKQVGDSLTMTENQKLQAGNEAKQKEKERQEREIAERKQREKQQIEAEAKQKAEIQAKEKKIKEEQDLAAARKAEQDAAIRKAQLAKEQEEAKKAREEMEAKALREKREKEADEQAQKQKQAQEEAKRKADDQARRAKAETEQRELEAKKEAEQQEKDQIKQQLTKLQEQNQSSDDETPKLFAQETDQAPKSNSRPIEPAHSLVSAGREAKKVIASGYIKSSKTLDPIANVSVNIRQLNSIVSQEVVTDQNGRYEVMIDSGYFYLASYYTEKYEISKQPVDLTSYKKPEYKVATQYLKENSDFDPNAKMQVVQFEKNSNKLSASSWSDLQSLIKTMDDNSDMKVKIYGLASLDEDQPMKISVDRARSAADILMENGIKPSKISVNGIGASRPRSGCTEGKLCTEDAYKLDRVVMYKVVKE